MFKNFKKFSLGVKINILFSWISGAMLMVVGVLDYLGFNTGQMYFIPSFVGAVVLFILPFLLYYWNVEFWIDEENSL